MNRFFRTRTLGTFLAICFFLAAPQTWARHVPTTDYDVLVEGVELRPGVEVDVHVRVFVNEDFPCPGRTVFAVHGFSSTAATWKPFAEAIFADNPTGGVVCRVAAIDLPSRGGSATPTNLLFGDLDLDDQVSAILGTLQGLRQQGVRPRTLVGLSQGSLLIQMAQQRLIDEGTSLRHRFRIRKAVLLGPGLPAEVPWLLQDTGAVQGLISQFSTVDPVLGDLVNIPTVAIPALYFTNFADELVPGAPTVAEIDALGYIAPEPLNSALQLIGAEPYTRPSIDAGVFARHWGTRLSVVSLEQDIFFSVTEVAALYEHLSGDSRARRLALVKGENAVHAMVMSNPEGLLQAVVGKVRF